MPENKAKTETSSIPKKRGIFDPSIMLHRERVAAAEPMAKPADVPFTDALIAIPGNIRIPVRFYTPPDTEPPYPTFIYIPGTAYVAHESKFTHLACSHIAIRAKCQIVVINHRLAPENTISDVSQDVYQVMKSILKSPLYKSAIDHSRVAIGGYSSGGHLAALAVIRARKEGIPIVGQILLSPLVELGRRLKDYKSFEEKDTDITEEFVNWFLSLAIPPDTNTKNSSISPFWTQKSDLKLLPPTAIVWAEKDRFRSDAEAYYKKMEEAGVRAKNLVINGENHAYMWRNLEIVERIADDILVPFFSAKRIERPLSHSVHIVTPRLTVEKHPDGLARENNVANPLLRSKL
jgi:acetyl esterase